MLKAVDITKKFDAHVAVDNISFNIDQGEVVGLLGPNGAGKTTTMRMLTGYYKPTAGKVLINEESMADLRRKLQLQIGYLPESGSSYADMAVADYLKFIANARGLRDIHLEDGIEYAVEATSLSEYYYRSIAELSKGFKRRVGLAAALLHNPDILILDEPTDGLDPNQILQIQDLIRQLAKDKTILLSTHILREVEATCKRAIIINRGKVVLDKSLSEIKKISSGSQAYHFSLAGAYPDAEQKLDNFLSGKKDFVVDSITSGEKESSFKVHGPADSSVEFFKFAVENSYQLSELRTEKISLEEVFRDLTKEEKGASGE